MRVDARMRESVTDRQGFPFHIQNIEKAFLSEEGLQEAISQNAALDGIPAKEMLQVLQDVFPVTPKGCFVVRLLPKLKNPDDESVDTFLVGTRTKSDSWDVVEFSEEAAKVNYERMTGKSRKSELYYLDYEEEEEEGGGDGPSTFGMILREDVELPKSIPYTMSFQTHRQRSASHTDRVVRSQEQIVKEYKKKFEDLANAPKPTFDQFRELVAAAFGAVQNVTKMLKPCPVKVDYNVEKQEYDLMLCPDGEEPIICDFERGYQSKALYIFFLRHPEGLRLKRLATDENIKELAQVYSKIKMCSVAEAFAKAKSIIKARAQNANDIKNLFEELFVPAVAGKYCIATLDKKRNEGKYGIDLGDELVDLGDFDGRL